MECEGLVRPAKLVFNVNAAYIVTTNCGVEFIAKLIQTTRFYKLSFLGYEARLCY